MAAAVDLAANRKRSWRSDSSAMQRLNKNKGGYFGETIDIRAALRDVEAAAREHHWTVEIFHRTGDLNHFGFHRKPSSSAKAVPIYISTGIHGDEPAGPLAALRLLQENDWPANVELWLCPCLNPIGFTLNRRENADGKDLNRDYLHLETPEIRAHTQWLERQPRFSFSLCLHEDWESHGFYIYELNLENRPSLADVIAAAVEKVCPIDQSEIIEGRPAKNGIIRPDIDPRSRPQWPEAFWLISHKTKLSCTLEAPSDFPLETRVNALVSGVQAAISTVTAG